MSDHATQTTTSSLAAPLYVRALYDYEPSASETYALTFREGDVIQVLDTLESGWYDGILHYDSPNAVRGWLPSTFVELMTPPVTYIEPPEPSPAETIHAHIPIHPPEEIEAGPTLHHSKSREGSQDSENRHHPTGARQFRTDIPSVHIFHHESTPELEPPSTFLMQSTSFSDTQRADAIPSPISSVFSLPANSIWSRDDDSVHPPDSATTMGSFGTIRASLHPTNHPYMTPSHPYMSSTSSFRSAYSSSATSLFQPSSVSKWPNLHDLVQFASELRECIHSIPDSPSTSVSARTTNVVYSLLNRLATPISLMSASHRKSLQPLVQTVKVALTNMTNSIHLADEASSSVFDADARILGDAMELDQNIVRLLRDGRKLLDKNKMAHLNDAFDHGDHSLIAGSEPFGLDTAERIKALCHDTEQRLTHLRSLTKRQIVPTRFAWAGQSLANTLSDCLVFAESLDISDYLRVESGFQAGQRPQDVAPAMFSAIHNLWDDGFLLLMLTLGPLTTSPRVDRTFSAGDSSLDTIVHLIRSVRHYLHRLEKCVVTFAIISRSVPRQRRLSSVYAPSSISSSPTRNHFSPSSSQPNVARFPLRIPSITPTDPSSSSFSSMFSSSLSPTISLPTSIPSPEPEADADEFLDLETALQTSVTARISLVPAQSSTSLRSDYATAQGPPGERRRSRTFSAFPSTAPSTSASSIRSWSPRKSLWPRKSKTGIAHASNGNGTLTPNDTDDDEVSHMPGTGPWASPIRKDKIRQMLGPDAPDAVEVVEIPWYLKPAPDEPAVFFNPEGTVRAGTLVALVNYLTPHIKRDPIYHDTFFMTYQSFTTCRELFKLLVDRFNLKPPDGLSREEHEDWEKRKLEHVRLRVINAMKLMLQSFPFESEEDCAVLDEMREFAVSSSYTPATRLIVEVDLIKSGEAILLTRRLQPNAPISPPKPIVPPKTTLKGVVPISLLDLDPLEVARQLALMEQDMFWKVQPKELLARARQEAKKIEGAEDNLGALASFSNQIARWLTSMILEPADSRKRAAIMKHFILIADHSRTLSNFSAMASIIVGLNSAPIHRLRRTWEELENGSKGHKMMALYRSMEQIVHTGKTIVEYRNMLSKVTLPALPFIGAYLTALLFIQDGMKDTVVENGVSLVNFAKRSKTFDLISDIQRYQSMPYNLKAVGTIQVVLKAWLGVEEDEDYFWALSQFREPKEGEQDKMMRQLVESGFMV